MHDADVAEGAVGARTNPRRQNGQNSTEISCLWRSLAEISVIALPARTVPNAVRLGSAADNAAQQSVLARAILVDHVFAFVRMAIVLGLQLAAQWIG